MARVLNKFQYGIELECYTPYSIPNVEYEETREQIVERLKARYIANGYDEDGAQIRAVQAFNSGNYTTNSNLTDLHTKIAEVGAEVVSDGSIQSPNGENGTEIRGGVYDDENIEQKVTELCRIANAHGSDVNKSCGFHVHTSHKRFLHRPTLNKLVHVWAAIEDVLFLTQPQSRFNNRYCYRLLKPFISGDFDNLPKEKRELVRKMNGIDRYTSLNLSALGKHHTVEVRLHSGTLDKEKIINWVKLLRSIYTYVFDFYDKEKVAEIFNMPISKEKVQAVFELIGLSEELKTYYTERIAKFYTEDNWNVYTEKLAKQNLDANKVLLDKEKLVEYRRRVDRARKQYEARQSELNAVNQEFTQVVRTLQ